MTRYVFSKVERKVTKRWTDSSGKKRQQTMSFWQTENPFNKNADGTPKTRAQLYAEVCEQARAWLAEPVSAAAMEPA